jgi:hypothetical protein
MSRSLEQLKTTLSSLPAEERAELAQYLLRSLGMEEEGARAEWLAVAEQRMAEVRTAQVVGIPAEEVIKHPALGFSSFANRTLPSPPRHPPRS